MPASVSPSVRPFKLAFHDADTDTDSNSPDTSIHPYIRYARFPREDPREEVAGDVCVAFQDTDTDILADIVARIVAKMSVSVSAP